MKAPEDATRLMGSLKDVVDRGQSLKMSGHKHSTRLRWSNQTLPVISCSWHAVYGMTQAEGQAFLLKILLWDWGTGWRHSHAGACCCHGDKGISWLPFEARYILLSGVLCLHRWSLSARFLCSIKGKNTLARYDPPHVMIASTDIFF